MVGTAPTSGVSAVKAQTLGEVLISVVAATGNGSGQIIYDIQRIKFTD
jgi:hypothetical protein